MILLLVAAGSGGCGALSREINLWPLMQYTKGLGSDESGYRFVGPLVRVQSSERGHEWAVYPIVRSRTPTGGYTDVVIVWPLGRYRETESEHIFYFVPLILDRTMNIGGDRRHSFLLFPLLYLSRSEETGSSFALFVFYGNVKRILGRDEMRWIAFPVYLDTRIGDKKSWNVLWPFLGGARGSASASFRILPLYAWNRRDGVYARYSYLWPFVQIQKNNLDTDRPTNLFFLFPFYGRETGRGKWKTVVLWPLFGFFEDEERGYHAYSVPWPFVQIQKLPYHSRTRVWPFYGIYRSAELTSRFYAWPLVWDRLEVTEEYRKRTFLVIPFWQEMQRVPLADDGKPVAGAHPDRTLLVWPFVKSSRRDERSRVVAPFPFPWLGLPGFEEMYSPLWTLYLREESGESGASEALLGAVRSRWNGAERAFSVPWLFQYHRDADGRKEHSFLLGLFGVDSGPGGGAFKLFSLPVVRW